MPKRACAHESERGENESGENERGEDERREDKRGEDKRGEAARVADVKDEAEREKDGRRG